MNDSMDHSLEWVAAGYINKQLAKLIKHLQGARTARDIEDVHQVRVACRRIRAAFRLFGDCFESDLTATWQRQIKKLLKSMGEARDLDVQIEFLQGILEGLDAEHKKVRPGIRRMMLRWQQRRNQVQSRVIKAIDKVQKKHLLTNIHIHMERVLFELTPLEPNPQSPAVRRRAYDQIQLCIRDLLDRQDALQVTDDIAGHHSVRIATKKLRYALEICDTALENKLKPAIKKIKHLQTVLGDMHDCDVWDADINQFIKQEKQRTIDFYGHPRPFARILPGLQYLQQERSDRRVALYQQSKAYLNQLIEESFWLTLPEIVQPEPQNPIQDQQESYSDEKDTDQ